MKFIQFCKGVFITLLISSALTGCHYLGQSAIASDAVVIGSITDKRVAEASGIATSRRDSGLYWINNDSGNPPTIYAVKSDGQVLAAVKISGVGNRDWEDIASFEYQGKAYILVAEVGDNDAQWPSYSIHIIAEPQIDGSKEQRSIKLKPEWSINFTYPDGKHDCESVAVDLQNQQVLLLTKRDSVPKLFALNLLESGKQVAQDLGPITPLPETKDPMSLFKLLNLTTMPTGMDISADGRSLAVITYGSAYLYSNPNHLPWQKVMSQVPREIGIPELRQAEAIGFDFTAEHILITSEKLPAPILKLKVLIPES